MKRFRSFLPLLVLIAIGIVLLSTGVLDRFRPENLAHEQATLQAQIAQHRLLASLAHIGAMTLAVATGIPIATMLIVLAGGLLFGVPIGATQAIVGLTLGSLILFIASRRAFGDHADNDAPGLAGKLRSGYLAHPVSYTFFLRFVPFFPFGGVTVALAWLRCPLWLFTTATAIGGAAMTTVEAMLGAAIAKNVGEQKEINTSLLHDPTVLLPLAGMALLALVPIVVNHWRTRKSAGV